MVAGFPCEGGIIDGKVTLDDRGVHRGFPGGKRLPSLPAGGAPAAAP